MGLRETITSLFWKPRTALATLEMVQEEFEKHHSGADVQYLADAYTFAYKAHDGQMRKSGEPYITHPTSVAFILASHKLDLETVAAGFLHDVVEDCDVELSELEERFGKGLARIVDGVTKIGKVKFRDKSEAQAENYRKMIMAMSEDVRVLLVKLADRTHNMQTLGFMKPEKQERIARETLDIFTPLAHRLGMSQLKTELERLSFMYLHPQAYAEVDRQIKERERQQQHFAIATTKLIEKLLSENEVGDCYVTSRIKNHYSIYRKMESKKTSIDGLYDYYAFRIHVKTVSDCYKSLGLLHSKWRHIPGRIKDFIATPKPNLYQSLHTTLISDEVDTEKIPAGIKFEVQIRTHMMHRIAEEGVAAHWTYKNGRLLSVGRNEFVHWLKKVIDDNESVSDNEEFLDSLKGQFKTQEILVFTPQSEIKTLPKGATPLDFAYLIHTEVGNRAVAAKVDGKMVPLRSELKSGSIVEIITKDTQQPNEEWLNFVATPSARGKIRSWLRAEEKTKAITLGKSILEREAKRLKVPMKTVRSNDFSSKVESELEYKKLDDFYAAIGYGNLTPRRALKPFLPEDFDDQMPSIEEQRTSRLKRAFSKLSRKSRQMVLVRGMDDVLVQLAKCCNPIVGDDIVGYISRGAGVTVHRRDCKSFRMQHVNQDRIIEVEWERSDDPEQLFRVNIRIFTEERTGMIATITTAIAATNTNIYDFRSRVDSQGSRGIFDIQLEIRSSNHFDKVVRAIRKCKGYLSHERIN
jgi:GTP pyrophosphokinase